MSDLPLVSVVAGTYNSGNYILEALESVKAQTYQNIELIITDDFSSDDTIEICRSWISNNKHRFVRIELLTSPINTGIPANCNRGVNAAHGSWIKLIAGDDAFVPTCIEDNIHFALENLDAKIIQSNCNYYTEHFQEDHYSGMSDLQNSKFFKKGVIAKEQNKYLLIKNRMLAPSVFINKQTLVDADGFDERLRLIEDLPLWIKLTGLGIKVYFFDKVTYNYRKSDESVVRNKQPFMRTEYAKELLLFYELYKKGNIPFIRAIRYKWGLKAIVFLNKIGLNKKGVINFILFKSVLKFVN